MVKTVEIHVMDDGTAMVGEVPAEAGIEESGMHDPMEGKEYLSPAESLDDALDVARNLLTGNAEEMDAEADAAMGEGYNSVRGDSAKY